MRRGRLDFVSEDTSNLEFGGTLDSNSNTASNGCSSNTFYDDCPGVTGTRVYTSSISGPSNKGPCYVLNGNTVTYCGRWRRESNCVTSNNAGSTVTTPTEYGASTRVQRVVASTTELSVLPVSRTLSGACSGVCVDPNDASNLIFPLQASSTCAVSGAWVAVNDHYDDVCAVQQTCNRLVVNQGCEGTGTGSLAGTYRPLANPAAECNGDYVDLTRSVYVNDDNDKYLFYRATQDEWVFNSFCSSLGNSKGYFDGGNEPFLNTEAEIQCYDEGFGSSKSYDWTTLELSCTEQSGGIENKGGLGTGEDGGTFNLSSSAASRMNGAVFSSCLVLVVLAVVSIL